MLSTRRTVNSPDERRGYRVPSLWSGCKKEKKQNGGPKAAVPLIAECYLLTAPLRSFRPARQILFLLRSEAIDLDAHGLQFQPGDFLIEFFRNRVDLVLQ